jgi:hypothetical protein
MGENKPATLDVLSIEWDPSYGAYYSSVVPSDGITTKKDGSKRANGIYLFNVDDTKYSFDSYCSVLVTANKSGWLNFGSKYTHTFTTYSTSATGAASFAYEGGGLTGGMSYKVTSQSNVSKWDLWEDNAVSIY